MFELNLTAGRNFSPEIASDSTAFILNASAARLIGWEQPVGKQLEWVGSGQVYTVIGVIADFQNGSWRSGVAPSIVRYDPTMYFDLMLKARPGGLTTVLPFLKRTWAKFLPDRPFQYRLLDELLERRYRNDLRFSRIVWLFGRLSILLACLGLYGLAVSTTEQRRKEIGIRKAVGASLPGILGLIARDLTRGVLLANLIAWPLAYLWLSDWLSSYIHRIPLSPGPFILASGIVLGVALATVGAQTLRAALANPVDALRCE